MRKTHKGRILSAQVFSALLGATVLCLGTASASRAQDVANIGPYVSVSGGINDPRSMDVAVRNPIGAAATDSHVHYDTGYMFTGAFGNKWSNGFRTEVEASYRKADINSIGATSLTGSQKVLSLMGNVLYDIDTLGRVNFSIGGGAGVGHNKWDTVTAGTVGSQVYDTHDTNLQWQAIGEVGLPLGHQMALFADYRYITLYDNAFTSTTGTSRISAGTDHSHNVLMGLRYYFG